MNENLPEWREDDAGYEGLPNNSFQIDFKLLDNKAQFIYDRGDLFMNIYNLDGLINKGEGFYNSIIEHIPSQDPKWRLTLCTELIDYYIDFLKNW